MGATIANIKLAATAQIIIVKPDGTKDKNGIYLKARLKAIAVITHRAVAFSFFAVGTTMAINIP